MNILAYLDSQIETFKVIKDKYPSKILMSKEVKDKIFAELNLISAMDLSWKEKQDNYRGIEILIKENIFIELEE
jgi:hypothetical protein